MRMSERNVCEGVIPSRPVLGFFSPSYFLAQN